MVKQIGYHERSYEHGPNRELLEKTLRSGRFDGISPDEFFLDRTAILERLVTQYEGRLREVRFEKVDWKENLGISALHRRIASFELPEDQALHIIDYSRISTVDCFPTGTEYVGKIILEGDSEELTQIEKVCQLIFPTDEKILKYI